MTRAHPILAALALSTVATTMSLVANAHVALAGSQTDIVGPAGSGQFGRRTLVLSNGNFVVTDPEFDKGAVVDVGAVYLYNGATRQLISTLTGSTAGDRVGERSINEVGDSNFVAVSTKWTNATGAPIAEVGAVTWVSGTTGLNGVVTPANSLVGTTAQDQLGTSFAVLSNGNFAVGSPSFRSAGQANAGAVTWGSGSGPTVGTLSAANSLVGTTAGDSVGSGGIQALSNGNFVVSSPLWDNAGLGKSNAGAATWGNGNDAGPRTVGPVSTANSLWGPGTENQVSLRGVLALSSGNYVVLSPKWDFGGVLDAGAATLGNGMTGSVAFVGAANSLHGAAPDDQVGALGVALSNGNYVIGAPLWDDTVGGHTDAGAATWRSGADAAVLAGGTVSQVNSLFGSSTDDIVSLAGIAALTNGNYVVQSPGWRNGAEINAGAATWGDGDAGTSGPVGAGNSLVGTAAFDVIGTRVVALSNGNYVASSSGWHNGALDPAGAVTWADGNSGLVGTVSPANSLVGATGDLVGSDIEPLPNGNYVVNSPQWNGQRGAVTWGHGTGGLVGAINDTNSLVGDQAGDQIGSSPTTALANGNYVVNSPKWNRGTVVDAGAATFGDGAVGVRGHVSPANSLVGEATADLVGQFTEELPDGAYMVVSERNNGTTPQAGSATFGLPTGVRGELTPANTVFGTAAASVLGPSNEYTADGSVLVRRSASNIVTLYLPDRTAPVFQPPADVTVAVAPGTTSTAVTYPLPVVTDDVGAPTVVCTPPSGSVFPVGSTTVTCTATNTEGLTSTTSFTVHVGADYLPVAPARVADTRASGETVDGLFAGGGLRAADSTLQLQIGGRGGVPVDALAVTLNVTVTEPTAAGFLTAYPCDEPRPTASNLNYSNGATIPNAVITKLAATGPSTGAVCIYVQQAVHVVVDVNGYFPPTTSYHPSNPARVIDTRAGSSTIDGLQQGTGIAAASSITTVQISGRAGVPADATAVVLNVTVTEPAAPGFATVYPCGTEPPTASNLNYTTGLTIPNLAIAKLGTGGTVCIFAQSATHLIADVLGYFPASTTYNALVPARLFDSRPAATTIDGLGAAGGTRPLGAVTVIHIRGRGGVPANATTAVLNVTITEPAAPGFATVYPCGIEPPLASNVNFVANQTIPNAVLTKIGTNGDVCIYNSQTTHLVTDVTGYFP